MRRSSRLGFFLLVLLACRAVQAQPLPALTIEKVRVGLPAGPESTRSRPGAWCPVYVTLKAGATVPRDSLRLVVQAPDADDTPFRYTVAVPALSADERQTVLTYTRPGSSSGAIDVRIVTADGRVVQSIPPVHRNSNDVLDPRTPLLVVAGSSSLRPDPSAASNEENAAAAKNLAYLENVAQLPDQWLGYDAADVVILTTNKAAFVQQLLDDTTGRRAALVEWVRRGGRLVLSVGKNQQAVARLLEKTGLSDCRLAAPVHEAQMPNLDAWVRAPRDQPLRGLELTVVHPGSGTTVLVHESAKDNKTQRPVLLQGACGLGRVILVAFDVEANPFASWSSRGDFWEQVQKALNIRSETASKPGVNVPQAEILVEMQRNLESFRDVPTVSFGWVALFTLFYIFLVGPFDYFVLKKVFKRLELTWATFPATVLLVSATAYLTAYWLKGDALHIKKLDLVEIDLHDNTACGTTWFALFSPKIENYTVGVEPLAPEWVAPPQVNDQPIRSWTVPTPAPHRPIQPTTLAVLAAPDEGRRVSAATLSPQPYDCTAAATGLEKVPIPIWATRSFTASWTARLTSHPPVAAALRLPRDARGDQGLPLGEITNNLPIALHGVSLFFRDQWFDLGTLEAGETTSVGELFTGGPKAPRSEWFKEMVLRPQESPTVHRNALEADPNFEKANNLRPVYQLMKQLLFYIEANPTTVRNSGLHRLDQSWRFWNPNVEQNRDEVILVARAEPLKGKAEELTAQSVAPTALWLGHLPGTVPHRPQLPGFLTQETYVRVYIPVTRGR